MKLTKKDVKFLSEGMQIRDAVLEKYGSIENFVEANHITISLETVKNYMRKKTITSETFKCNIAKAFDKGYYEIALDEKGQLEKYVDNVSEEIKAYTDEKDLEVLEYLRDMCLQKQMTVYTAKMYRAIAMHHYYRNNSTASVDLMKLAINLLENRKENILLIRYMSELGLIYFYGVKYVKAREMYEAVEEKIAYSDNLDKETLYRHYYRKGILHNNTSEHTMARQIFQKSLSYTDEPYWIGRAYMNIGLTHKKQGSTYEALKYYEKALDCFEPGDNTSKNIVLNNMAEVYKIQENYDKALGCVEKAFELLGETDITEYFITLQTYVEIKVLKNETENAFDKLLELLSKAENFFAYKKSVIDAILLVLRYGSRDVGVLRKLRDAIIRLVKNTTLEEYQKELKIYLCDVFLTLNERGDMS